MTEEFKGPKTKVEMTMTVGDKTETASWDMPTADLLADDMPKAVKQLEEMYDGKISSVKVGGVEVHSSD